MKKCMFLLLGWALSAPAFSQAGNPDTTFGENGVVLKALTSGDNEADAMAVQPDGKILVGGLTGTGNNLSMGIFRLNPDGSTDTGFGEEGQQIISSAAGRSFIKGIAVQPDGKIIAAGYIWDGSQGDILVARLNSDGTPDSSFGDNGIKVADNGGSEIAQALILRDNGKFVVAGDADDKFMAVQFNPDGSLDTTFGINGWAINNVGTVWSYAFSMAEQPDGKLVLGGFSVGADYQVAVMRLETDGSLDGDFGTGGLLAFNVGNGNDFSDGVAIQEDGKILIAGHKWISDTPILQYDMFVTRLNENGTFDTSYGTGGTATAQFVPGENYTTGIVLQSDQKALITGNHTYNGVYNMSLARFTADGVLDAEFGEDGMVNIDIDSGEDFSNAIALQSDEKILLAGYTYKTSGNQEMAVLRFLNEEELAVHDFSTTSVKIYPNPAVNELNIETDLGENTTAEIFDISGLKVMTANLKGSDKIDVSSLPSGVYIIRVSGEKGLETLKFIKK